MKFFLISSLLALTLLSCDTSEELSYAREANEINGGYAEPGEPGVVLIWHQMGYMCTGTLIKPTIVLTAKHCVRDLDSGYDLPVYGFRVRIGPDMWDVVESYNVSDIYTYPGTAIEDEDIALMVLSEAIPESVATPYPIVVSSVGEDALTPEESILSIIGYGESVCGGEGNSGVKLRTEDTFLGYYTGGGDFATQGRGANHGDSGGPIFTDQMKVVGVTSRGSDECVGELAGFTIGASVAHHNSFIADIIESEGYCAPTANSDICDDGEDNDCNGYIDDGCLIPGELCTQNWECGNGICYNQDGVSRCIKSCDPYVTTTGCGSGYFCEPQGCGEMGICSAGTSGTVGFFEPCNQNSDCESLFCAQSGDGVSRCLYPCEQGGDHCLMNEACVITSAGCGGCVPSSEGPTQNRSQGEPCSVGTECASGYCYTDDYAGYCTTACDEQSPCSDGFHCVEGSCLKGNVGEMGDPCLSESDCGGGLTCVDFGGGVGHCSVDCSDGAGCSEEGFYCATDLSGGQFCKQSGGMSLGDSCAVTGCQPGLFCVEAATDDFRCVSLCHRYDPDGCPANTGCYALNREYCLPFNSAVSGNDGGDGGGLFGCTTGHGTSPAPLGVTLALLLSALWVRRKNILKISK